MKTISRGIKHGLKEHRAATIPHKSLLQWTSEEHAFKSHKAHVKIDNSYFQTNQQWGFILEEHGTISRGRNIGVFKLTRSFRVGSTYFKVLTLHRSSS